jgi:hypothetical protein
MKAIDALLNPHLNVLPVELPEANCKSVHFLLTEYQKWQTRDNPKYHLPWINRIFLNSIMTIKLYNCGFDYNV